MFPIKTLKIDGVETLFALPEPIHNLVKGEFCLTGSRVICDPPALNTDIDVVIQHSNSEVVYRAMRSCGFSQSSVEDYVDFTCFRSETSQINFIVCHERFKYERWIVATRLARAMNLLEKEQRCLLFQYIVDEREDF